MVRTNERSKLEGGRYTRVRHDESSGMYEFGLTLFGNLPKRLNLRL